MLDLDNAIHHLEVQGISVSPGIVGQSGFVFNVGGFFLTGSQILRLHARGRLTLRGVKQFIASPEYCSILNACPN